MIEKYTFGVITAIEADAQGYQEGNAADTLIFNTGDKWVHFQLIENVTKLEYIEIKVPAFTLGEILVLNQAGREVCGKGRKPYKWSNVVCEYFHNIEDAITRATEITTNELHRH